MRIIELETELWELWNVLSLEIGVMQMWHLWQQVTLFTFTLTSRLNHWYNHYLTSYCSSQFWPVSGRDFGLQSRCKWDLLSSEILRSAEW